jgi:hypothetical protein
MPVADIADHEQTSAVRRGLEQLSNDAGAKLLRALGVKGHEEELRNASDEFSGHCLALTLLLLGSYLNDMAALANAIFNAGILAHFEHDVSQAERSASDVIELSTRHNLPFWLTIGSILRGWVRSVSGDTVKGISWIERKRPANHIYQN